MPRKKKERATQSEADLETRIQGVLRRVFATLPEESFEHQTRFSFQVGSSVILVDGKLASRADARSDILIRLDDVPLAVLELKRKGRKLTEADDRQGMSYAAMLIPHPPLVIVTNGDDVRMLESWSGKPWEPTEASDAAVKALFENASRVAAHDTRRALDYLLGTTSAVWAPAIRATTDAALEELQGDWGDQLSPFVSEFLIPRTATGQILEHLRKGKRFVLLEGAPLAGKSNVLRDLAARTAGGDEFVILYLEADGGADSGILDSLAGHLLTHLNWPVTPREARTWLHTLSHRAGGENGPALVLVIDGMRPDQRRLQSDLEDLTSSAFGLGVRVVLAVDDSVAELLTVGNRKPTKIGRRATHVEVEALDDEEFDDAVAVMERLRFRLMHGARRSVELRVPWILRAIFASIVETPQYEDETLMALIPPLVGIELVDLARQRFAGDPRLRALMRDVAHAILEESEDSTRSVPLRLASALVFVVRRATLQRSLSDRTIDELVSGGSLRLVFPDVGESEPLYLVRLPELIAATVARLLEEEFAKRISEAPRDAVDWLVKRAMSLPIGDVIAARALLDYALSNGGLPEAVVVRLSELTPSRESFKLGGRYALAIPGGPVIDVHIDQDGSLVDSATGGLHLRISREGLEEDRSVIYGNLHAWLILSHLAGVPMLGWRTPASVPGDLDRAVRLDPALLAMLLDNPFPLIPVVRGHEPLAFREHSLPQGGTTICHEEGIIEPVTLSLFRFLSSSGAAATKWIEQTVTTGSLASAMRLSIALSELARSANEQKSSWAEAMLRDHVLPVLSSGGMLH